MPVLKDKLEPEGALVDVLVGLSRTAVRGLRQAGRPVPAAAALRALLDTGAECTCVDLQAAGLALPVAGFSLVNAPALGGMHASAHYDASIVVVHPSGDPKQNWVLADLAVADEPLGVLGYQALLGRDILAQSAFVYHGRLGKFRLSY
jgi:hypothetical protein